MAEAGLIEAEDLNTIGNYEWAPKSLKWEGHEFLDTVRNETVWAKTKEVVKSKGGSVAFAVLKELAIQMSGIHVKRDKLPSIAYSEELISFAMSATLQNTDRRHGIVGQECCPFQRDA